MVGALERPYSGDIHVKPDAFQSAVDSFAHHAQPSELRLK